MILIVPKHLNGNEMYLPVSEYVIYNVNYDAFLFLTLNNQISVGGEGGATYFVHGNN